MIFCSNKYLQEAVAGGDLSKAKRDRNYLREKLNWNVSPQITKGDTKPKKQLTMSWEFIPELEIKGTPEDLTPTDGC